MHRRIGRRSTRDHARALESIVPSSVEDGNRFEAVAVTRALTGLLVALLASACGDEIPDHELRPSVVGVVEDAEFIGPREVMFRLSGGRELLLDLNEVEPLLNNEPQEGELLIYGEDNGRPWAVGLWGGGDCYWVTGWGEIRDGRMVFSSGLSLPLAPDFDDGGRDTTRFVRDRGHDFCINPDGEVASVGS